MSQHHSKSARDNRANQLNPNHPAYYESRGATSDEARRMAEESKPAPDSRANHLHPNGAATKASPGEPKASSSASSNTSSAKPK